MTELLNEIYISLFRFAVRKLLWNNYQAACMIIVSEMIDDIHDEVVKRGASRDQAESIVKDSVEWSYGRRNIRQSG